VSLTSYLGTSCSLGPLTFSNFQFISSASPGLDAPAASDFTVSTLAVVPFEPGTDADFLTFSGWYALSNAGLTTGSRSLSFDISFDYQVVPANYRLDTVVISGSTGDDGIFVTEGLGVLSPCGALQEGNSYSPCYPTGGETLSGTVVIEGYAEAFPGIPLANTAFVGYPSLRLFVTAAPEPSTGSMMSIFGALAVCGWKLRRRTRSFGGRAGAVAHE
jgi:hypothetical protein